MNKFYYTLPSGKRFTVTASDDTTQAQADFIFYSQVAAGTLVGFAPGQSVGTAQAQAIKFALSRLDRGTAGVDDRVILSIVNGIPAISGIPDLVNVPLENPISQADVANIGFDNTFSAPAIGPLNANQVQGVLAQIANFVDQPADQMSDTTGVGLYGFDCQQLEQTGYVKPGTYRQFVFEPSPLTQVLQAPGIWTGKNGVTSVDDFLTQPSAQNDAMTSLLERSYDNLTANGSITPPYTPPVTAAVGQVYTQSGLQTVSQLSSLIGLAIPTTGALLSSLAKTPISSLLSTTLTNVGSLASGAINSITGSVSNVTNIVSNLSNTVTGGVAALVSNGGIFGTSAVTQWANSGSLDQLLTGGGFGGAQGGSFTGLATNLTNNIAGLNVLGKASQFASGFSNPLSNLSNLGNFNLSSLTAGLPNINDITNLSSTLSGTVGSLTSNLTGSLTNLVSGQLSSITGALSGQFGGLISSLGNFGGLSNLSSLGDLGSLGGLFGGGGDALVSQTKVAAGYSNTVNRSVVDTAFQKIVGSNKVPLPDFDYPSTASASTGSRSDTSYAQNILKSLQGSNQTFDLGTTVFNPNASIEI
jgi:hypothetical protein